MRAAPRTSRSSPVHRLRAAAAAVFLASLAACANWPSQNDTPDTGELLRNSLPVAAAALAAGQLDVARRLYLALAERFDNAAEPFLGLGYIAFQDRDFTAAEKYFLQAGERASDTPAMQAEALLGAGRTALVQGRTRAARRHFRSAQAPGQDTPSAAWIANGLAVTAALDGDHEAAEAHYAEALRRSSGHPRIAANFVRMLVAAGRIDDAARAYAEQPPSYWADDDGPTLSRLIEESRREHRILAPASPRAMAPDTALDVSRAQAGAAPSQIGRSTSPLRPSAVAPARPEPEDPVLAPSPRLLDPSLALRLYVPGPPPAQPYPDTPLSAGITPQDRMSLMLHLEPWSGPPTPPPAADDATLKSAAFAGSMTSPSPPGGSSSLSPAAAGATPAALQAQSLRPPQPIATGASSTALASNHDMPQSDAAPPVPESTAPHSGSTALASELSRPEPSAARPPSPSTTPSAAQSHPLPEPEAPAAGMLDHSPPTTMTLTLGQSRRLHLDHDATTVLVASPEIADVQLLAPNVLYVIGKGVGRTSVAVLDDNEWIEERVVAVVLDLEPLRTILAGEPDLSGVRARRLSRGMALTGEVASAASADRALRLAAGALPEGVPIENELRVAAPQQVNLEVQIAEVHRSVTEDLGVNWESFGTKNSERFGFRIGRALPPVDGNLGLGGFPPAVIDGNLASSIFFGSEGPLGQFRVMIDALATAGLANVLARPNVTAISGESASFFSGGEFPLPTGFDDGVLVFSYKKYGVLLDFVPTVVDTGRIVLTVRPEVSEPSLNQSVTVIPGVTVPVINVRRAETTVEVGDGESIVIAGLFRNTSNSVESGLPGLKDVPLLGLLFGQTSVRSDELELIVVVTARLVQANTVSDDTSAPPATLRANGYHY